MGEFCFMSFSGNKKKIVPSTRTKVPNAGRRKPYCAPSFTQLDPEVARKLLMKGDVSDPVVQQMLRGRRGQ